LSWDSSQIERISFYAITQDPAAFGIQFELIRAVASAESGEYYKLAVPYQWPPGILDLLR
jgi:hypothetical protein